LRGEGHSAAGWGTGGSVELLLQVQNPFVRAIGSPLIAPRRLLPVLVSTPLPSCKPLL